MNPSDMLTVTELSEQTGIERSLIWYYVKKLGIEGERISGQRILLLSPSDAERIKMSCSKYQIEEGSTSITKLAIELGVSRQTVWAVAKSIDWEYLGKPRSKAIIGPIFADEIREAINDRKADR